MKNIYLKSGIYVGAGMSAAYMLVGKAFGFTTASLTASLESIRDTVVSYFDVLLSVLFPIVVGAAILLTGWYLGRRLIGSFR